MALYFQPDNATAETQVTEGGSDAVAQVSTITLPTTTVPNTVPGSGTDFGDWQLTFTGPNGTDSTTYAVTSTANAGDGANEVAEDMVTAINADTGRIVDVTRTNNVITATFKNAGAITGTPVASSWTKDSNNTNVAAVTGVAQVDTITIGGTNANVVVNANNEKMRLHLNADFEGGRVDANPADGVYEWGTSTVSAASTFNDKYLRGVNIQGFIMELPAAITTEKQISTGDSWESLWESWANQYANGAKQVTTITLPESTDIYDGSWTLTFTDEDESTTDATVVVADTTTVGELVTSMGNAINNDTGAFVSATVDGANLEITVTWDNYGSVSSNSGTGVSSSTTGFTLSPTIATSTAGADGVDGYSWDDTNKRLTIPYSQDNALSGVTTINSNISFITYDSATAAPGSAGGGKRTQGFANSSTIFSVQTEMGVDDPTSIVIDPDTGNTVYTSSLSSFDATNEESPTSYLKRIGAAVAALETNITYDSKVYDGTEFVGPLVASTAYDGSGNVSGSKWAIFTDDDATTRKTVAATDDISDLEDLFIVGSSTFWTNTFANDDVVLLIIGNCSAEVTLTESGFKGVSSQIISDGGYGFKITNVENVSGTFGTAFGTSDITLTASMQKEVASKYIDIDMGTTTAIDHSATLTLGGGSNGEIEVDGLDGNAASGQATTITVTDYAGNEVTSFTKSSSSATDDVSGDVVTAIKEAINTNEETPIDFAATESGKVVTLTADEAGAITGNWTVTINNHGQSTDAGTLTATVATTTTGVDAVAAETAYDLPTPTIVTTTQGADAVAANIISTSLAETLEPLDAIPVRIDLDAPSSGEIGAIYGDLSQPFEIAATEIVNRYLKHAMDSGGQEIPGVYQPIAGSLQSDSETLIKQCNLIIEEWDNNTKTYSCKLEASIIPLNDTFDGLLINGTDQTFDDNSFLSANPWDTHDHEYKMSTFVTQATANNNPDYIYPFIDFGFDEDGRPRIPDGKTVEGTAFKAVQDYTDVPETPYDDYPIIYGESQNEYSNDRNYEFQGPQPQLVESSTHFFGEVSRKTGSKVTQGFISHPSTPLRIDQLKPAVKLNTLVKIMFELASNKAGRSITVDTSTWSDELDNCYVLPNEKEGLGLVSQVTSDYGTSVEEQVSATDTSKDVSITNIVVNRKAKEEGDIFKDFFVMGEHGHLSHTNDDYDETAWASATNFDNGEEFTIPYNGTYTFVFKGKLKSIDFDSLGTNDEVKIAAAITMNGEPVERAEDFHFDDDSSGDYEFEVKHTGRFFKGQKVTGVIANVWTRRTALGDTNIGATIEGAEFYTEFAPLEWADQTAKLGDQFGELEVTEMLEGIMTQFNMVLYEDKTQKDHYHIVQYFDWILAGNRVDWSDRVQNLRYQNNHLEQSKKLQYIPAEDDDRFSQTSLELGHLWGQSTYTSPSDQATGETEIGGFFGPLVNATQTVSYKPNASVKSVTNSLKSQALPSGIPHLYKFEDNEKKAIATKPRIGFRRNTTVDPFWFVDKNDAPGYWSQQVPTLASSGEVGQGDLNWENAYPYQTVGEEGAYETYYRRFIDHLYNQGSRRLIADVYFTPEEFATLQLNDTVHIQGTDYLIQSIKGFNLSNPDYVTVELVYYDNNFDTVFTTWSSRYIEDTTDLRSYTLGIQFKAVDEDDNEIPQTVVQDTFMIAVTGTRAVSADSVEADTFTERVTFTPRAGYDLSASNFVDPTLPTGVTLGDFTDDGDQVYVDVTIAIQDTDTKETIEIEAEVDPVSADVNSTTVNFSVSPANTNVTIGNASKEVKGTEGTSLPISVIVQPISGKQIDADKITTGTLPSGVTLSGKNNLGLGAILDFDVEIGSSNATKAVTLNFSATDTITDAPESGISTVTVDFNESISNVSIAPSASFTITGVSGTKFYLPVKAFPADGFKLNPSNFSISETSDTSNVYTSQDAVGDNTAVEIPGFITFPTADASVTLSVAGSAQNASGANEQTVTVSYSTTDDDGDNIEGIQLSETEVSPATDPKTYANEVFTGNYDTTLDYYMYMYPDRGTQILTEPTVTSSKGTLLEKIDTFPSGQGFCTHFKIHFGSTATDSATITVSAETEDEPHQVTIDMTTKGLKHARLNTGETVTVGYGSADFDTADSVTILVHPDDGYIFSADDDITFTTSTGLAVEDTTKKQITQTDIDADNSAYIQEDLGAYEFQASWTYPASGSKQNPVYTLELDGGAGVSMKPYCELYAPSTQELYGPSYTAGDSGAGNQFWYALYTVRLYPSVSSDYTITAQTLRDTNSNYGKVVDITGVTVGDGDGTSHNSGSGTITSTNTRKWSSQNSYTATSNGYDNVNIYIRYAEYGNGSSNGTTAAPVITVHHPDAGTDSSGDEIIEIHPVGAKTAREIIVDNGDLPPDRSPASTYRPGAIYYEKEST